MRHKTLAIFAAVTLILAVAAFIVQGGRVGPTARSGGDLLFPGLAGELNEVASIAVLEDGERLTLAREGNEWMVTERGGYPARFEAVKKALIGLAELKTFEAKTAEPASYARIEVEDPEDEDAKSKLVTVTDGDGKTLAALIVGKLRFAKGGLGPSMIYVRRAGEARSWLASGDLDVGGDIGDWIDKSLLDISSDRMRRVTLTPADGKPVVIGRKTGADDKFTVENLPEGAEISSESDVRNRTSVLFGLTLDDVRPAALVPFAARGAGKAEYRTLDGLVIRIDTAKHENRTWIAIEAALDEAGRVEPDAAQAGGEDATAKRLTLDDVKEEVEEINQRTRGWAFAVPGYKLDYIRSSLDDLLKKPDKKDDGSGDSR